MKRWYLELIIDEELYGKFKKLIDSTGEDGEEILLIALREYVYQRTN